MINTYYYNKKREMKCDLSRADMLAALKDREGLLWVDLESPNDFESECLVEIFNFHPLAIEDCLSDHSEPKVDDYEEYLFLVMHAVGRIRNEEKETDELTSHELAIFLGSNYVVTFHKTPVWSVGQVRDVVKRKTDAAMGHGSDKLLHAILDHLVDHYQPVLNQYDDKIDKLEEEIFNNPPANYLAVLMQVKQDIFHLRRIVLPQRETISFLTRNPEPFIREEHLMYFRDIYDHLYRIYGVTENFHEMLSSILQVYFSYSSHKLNEIVKHMTVLATLSMPAILIASLFGMNFSRMPALHTQWGFGGALALSGMISLVMLVWMKWKKWI